MKEIQKLRLSEVRKTCGWLCGVTVGLGGGVKRKNVTSAEKPKNFYILMLRIGGGSNTFVYGLQDGESVEEKFLILDAHLFFWHWGRDGVITLGRIGETLRTTR